jgi:hypothetical protein
VVIKSICLQNRKADMENSAEGIGHGIHENWFVLCEEGVCLGFQNLVVIQIYRRELEMGSQLFCPLLENAHAITGYEWQSMNGSWRSGYVAGVLDAWAEAASAGHKEGKSNTAWISYRQVARHRG